MPAARPSLARSTAFACALAMATATPAAARFWVEASGPEGPNLFLDLAPLSRAAAKALAAKDLAVRLAGRRLVVLSALAPPDPLHLVLLADRSEATRTDEVLYLEALRDACRRLPASASISVVAFGTRRSTLRAGPTTREALLSRVPTLPRLGPTADLGDALADALDAVRDGQQPRAQVLLISFARDPALSGTGPEARRLRERLLRRARHGGAPIHCLSVGRQTDRSLLDALSRASGGLDAHAYSALGLRDELGTLVASLRRTRRVRARVPEDVPGGEHQVSVSLRRQRGPATHARIQLAPPDQRAPRPPAPASPAASASPTPTPATTPPPGPSLGPTSAATSTVTSPVSSAATTPTAPSTTPPAGPPTPPPTTVTASAAAVTVLPEPVPQVSGLRWPDAWDPAPGPAEAELITRIGFRLGVLDSRARSSLVPTLDQMREASAFGRQALASALHAQALKALSYLGSDYARTVAAVDAEIDGFAARHADQVDAIKRQRAALRALKTSWRTLKAALQAWPDPP